MPIARAPFPLDKTWYWFLEEENCKFLETSYTQTSAVCYLFIMPAIMKRLRGSCGDAAEKDLGSVDSTGGFPQIFLIRGSVDLFSASI